MTPSATSKHLPGRRLVDRSVTERSEVSKDAAQEACPRAWQKWTADDPATGSVAGWLHGILNKVLLETARDLRRQPGQVPLCHDCRTNCIVNPPRSLANSMTRHSPTCFGHNSRRPATKTSGTKKVNR